MKCKVCLKNFDTLNMCVPCKYQVCDFCTNWKNWKCPKCHRQITGDEFNSASSSIEEEERNEKQENKEIKSDHVYQGISWLHAVVVFGVFSFLAYIATWGMLPDCSVVMYPVKLCFSFGVWILSIPYHLYLHQCQELCKEYHPIVQMFIFLKQCARIIMFAFLFHLLKFCIRHYKDRRL